MQQIGRIWSNAAQSEQIRTAGHLPATEKIPHTADPRQVTAEHLLKCTVIWAANCDKLSRQSLFRTYSVFSSL